MRFVLKITTYMIVMHGYLYIFLLLKLIIDDRDSI